jgi:hypothetical protein
MSDPDKEEGELEEGELSEELESEKATLGNGAANGPADTGSASPASPSRDDSDDEARGRSERKRKRSRARSEDSDSEDSEGGQKRPKERLDEFGRVIDTRPKPERAQERQERQEKSDTPSKRHAERSDRPPGQRVRYSDRAISLRAVGTQTDLVGSEIEREARASERSEALEHEVGKQRLELQILNQKLLEAGRLNQVTQGQRQEDEKQWAGEKEGLLAMKAQLVNQVAEMEVLLEDVQEKWTKVATKQQAAR